MAARPLAMVSTVFFLSGSAAQPLLAALKEGMECLCRVMSESAEAYFKASAERGEEDEDMVMSDGAEQVIHIFVSLCRLLSWCLRLLTRLWTRLGSCGAHTLV